MPPLFETAIGNISKFCEFSIKVSAAARIGLSTDSEQREDRMKSLGTVLVMLAGLAPAHAFTCADVLALTSEQQAYYVKAYNITPAQQGRIRHVCYASGQRKPVEVAAERPNRSLSQAAVEAHRGP
jgi:hypothetical protein